MKLTEVRQRKVEHAIIFGDPKTGKSTLVSKLALAGFKLLWFSLDNGHTVLWKLPTEAQERVELIVLPDTKDFPVSVNTLLKVFSGNKTNICDMHGQVDCVHCKTNNNSFTSVCLNELPNDMIVVIDNLSQFSNSVMNFINKKHVDDFKPGFDEWRLHGDIIAKLLMLVQNARYNVAAIAHVVEVEMEDGKLKLVPECGTRNFSRNVAKYFDTVIYTETKNLKHTAGSRTTYSASAITGSRMDFDIDTNNLDISALFIKGNGDVETAKQILTEVKQLEEAKQTETKSIVVADNKPTIVENTATKALTTAELLAKLKGKK